MKSLTLKEILVDYKDGEVDLETALDQMADIGYCPNLLNDDNGFWALAFDGYQSLNTGKAGKNTQTSFFVEKKYWKKNPRKAILYHLIEEKNEEQKK
jgi:hypothetical protein